MDFYKNQMEKPDFFEKFLLYFSHLPPKASEQKKPGSKAPVDQTSDFFSGGA